ncbi:DUF411 domain-containing protein [Halomonas sp. E19]|uniref:DUF411 domain-containing protein n=1 Tax=Halomonas sp. E19 TaxID=3397247 RepID=UPI0040336B12
MRLLRRVRPPARGPRGRGEDRRRYRGGQDQAARRLALWPRVLPHHSDGGYAIEGHVPFEAVEKLFEERPDTRGIGLAGMPIGTPGMPGPKRGDWDVYQFRGGEAKPFMTL